MSKEPPEFTIKEERERRYERAFKSALEEAKAAIGPVELTAADIRNGWTEETLRMELTSAMASQALRIDPHSVSRRKPMPRMQSKVKNGARYRPHRWRG